MLQLQRKNHKTSSQREKSKGIIKKWKDERTQKKLFSKHLSKIYHEMKRRKEEKVGNLLCFGIDMFVCSAINISLVDWMWIS